MGIVPRIDLANISAEVKDVIEGHKAKGYRITNMKETLLHSITAFQSLEDGLYNLQENMEQYLEKRTILIYGYAISSNDDCLICSNYFKKLLDDNNIDFDTFDFSDDELLLIDFGKQMVENKGHVSDDVLARLRARFDDKQLVEITSFGAILVANNFFNNALKVDLDDYLLQYVQ